MLKEKMICQALGNNMEGKIDGPGPILEPRVERLSHADHITMLDMSMESLGTYSYIYIL